MSAPTAHVYEVRPRKDKRGVDLISEVLPFGRLWYDTPDHIIRYAMHSSRFPSSSRAADSRLLFLAQLLKSGIATQWIPGRMEP